MDAAEHYHEAERLIAVSRNSNRDPRDTPVIGSKLIEAQVHATLALAGELREANASRAVVRRMGSPA